MTANAVHVGDDLVCLAGNQTLKHLPLALGKARDPLGDRRQIVIRLFSTLLERCFDGIEDGPFIEWLLDEIDGARLHRLDR